MAHWACQFRMRICPYMYTWHTVPCPTRNRHTPYAPCALLCPMVYPWQAGQCYARSVLCTTMYLPIPPWLPMYLSIPPWGTTYHHVLLPTIMYYYVLLCTTMGY